MPDLTTTQAAIYLKDRGFTVKRRRVGGEGAPQADTLKSWCAIGKIKAVKSGHGNRSTWLIPQSELDRLLERVTREREDDGH
jgi:hypothetical protein